MNASPLTHPVLDVSVEDLSAETISETALKIHWVPPARIHWKGTVFYYIVVSNFGPRAAQVPKSDSTISNVFVTFQPQVNHPDPSLASEPLLPENYQLEDLEENYQYSIIVTIANSAGAGKPPLPVVQTMPESGELLAFSLYYAHVNKCCTISVLRYCDTLLCSPLWTSNQHKLVQCHLNFHDCVMGSTQSCGCQWNHHWIHIAF